MKNKLTLSASTALIFGAALLSTPALAQAGQTVTPPLVVPTVPQSEIVTPPPAVRIAPPAPVVQAIPETPAAEAEAAPAPVTRRAPARAARPAAAPTAERTAAPAEPAPVAAEPVAEVPLPVTDLTPAEVAAPAPIAPPVEEVTPVEEARPAGGSIWPWLLGGVLLAVAAIAFLLMRRRNETDEYAEEYEYAADTAEAPAADPVLAAAPLVAAERPLPRHEPEVAPRVAAPVADVEIAHPVVSPDDATITAADAEDVAGMVAGSAPVSHRPWLELGMRPVRAGTSADEALVEIELIVGNAGDMTAEDVRISTFMIPGNHSASEMERMLIEHGTDTAVPVVSIEPGEGKTVDATLGVPRAEVQAQGESFSPVIVADARYRLPDGSEGRTSASFRIGVSDEGGPGEPIMIGRRAMYDNVVAELEGAPARV